MRAVSSPHFLFAKEKYMVKDKKLQLYRVIPKYIDALRDEANGGDLRVYKVSEGKEHRPFVGIITEFNGQKYCIPLTKYKPKFKVIPNGITIMKIEINGRIVGVIEFSRMIPVNDNVLRPLDLTFHKHDTVEQKQEKQLRCDESHWITEHSEEIISNAKNLYKKYVLGEEFKRKVDCLNFPELEKVALKYAKEHSSQHTPGKKLNRVFPIILLFFLLVVFVE